MRATHHTERQCRRICSVQDRYSEYKTYLYTCSQPFLHRRQQQLRRQSTRRQVHRAGLRLHGDIQHTTTTPIDDSRLGATSKAGVCGFDRTTAPDLIGKERLLPTYERLAFREKKTAYRGRRQEALNRTPMSSTVTADSNRLLSHRECSHQKKERCEQRAIARLLGTRLF